ncbi:MAG TPA: hypothetical protein VMS22_24745 [Candidatus Eisenbacteria bacterium]|nr:hypothetical protein [Candidatus Eisenbacteria bacterium]
MRGVRAIAVLALVASARAWADSPAADPASYLCYQAKPARADKATERFAPPAALQVTDRFATTRLGVRQPVALCRPVLPAAMTPLMTGFAAVAHGGAGHARRVGVALDAVTRLGSERVVLKVARRLLVSSAAPGAVVATGDPPADLTCYDVKATRRARRVRTGVADATGERLLDVRAPTRLCAGADHDVLCYAARVARTRPLAQPRATPYTTTLATKFGTGRLRVGRETELCVPLLRFLTPPVEPPFTLEVTPQAQTVMVGEHPAFAATAHAPDGTTTDYSAKVLWLSSDESVATTASSAGGVFVDPVGPGMATIGAVDPETGVRSADSGGDATLTVTWPLEKLTIAPHAVAKRPGDHEGYTVTGYFTGGITKNLTQRVVYASSAPAIARATNRPGNRSRVEALKRGTAVISATDPISGIGTTDTANDATLRVTGALSYVWLSGNSLYGSRFPGEAQRMTAHGVFADGSTLNLTQTCSWSSSEPAVAAATNPANDRSRIDAIAPGLAFITCTDPATGIMSYPLAFHVLGALSGIEVSGTGSPGDWLRNGQTLRLTAIGTYEGGGSRNVTQEVTWTSRDPGIAVATDTAGDRSRFVAVDGGDARVFATDPGSGMASPDVVVHVLGDLVALEIDTGYPPNVIPVGSQRAFAVRGIFENGSRNLSQAGLGYVLESSDPGVAEIVGGGLLVHAVAAGYADIRARDVATGILSPPVTVAVQGALASITLDPPAATRGIGEWESFTAIGHYPPAFTGLLTQECVYSSSDPSVAVADDAPPNRSRVRTVGAGTATITATHVATGVTATAVVTVLPGAIESITVQPGSVVRNLGNGFSFTAIGHYPDGTTLNVTQIVTWASLAPDVADATNEAGNRSRVVGRDLGTAVVTARHPSGVSSHDSGGDAVLTVRRLVASALTPSPHAGHVGNVVPYTLVGTFDDGSTINLTQDAYYWADDGNVARFDNAEGNRSPARLVGPGTTTVHAVPALWGEWSYDSYPVAGGSVAGAFLTVEP